MGSSSQVAAAGLTGQRINKFNTRRGSQRLPLEWPGWNVQVACQEAALGLCGPVGRCPSHVGSARDAKDPQREYVNHWLKGDRGVQVQTKLNFQPRVAWLLSLVLALAMCHCSRDVFRRRSPRAKVRARAMAREVRPLVIAGACETRA